MAVSQTLTREEYRFMAKLAHQAERYKDMMNYMQNLATVEVSPSSDLTLEEQKLLFGACTNVIGSLRSAWRSVACLEQKKEGRKDSDPLGEVQEYRARVEAEIAEVCEGILELLNKTLIPSASSSESNVFYLTKKGDYERYLTESKVGDDRKLASERAMTSYKTAERIALADIRPAHPIRLGLAINFSVFLYDILDASQTAYGTASLAFSDALSDVNSLPEELYKESTRMMQLLQDNLTLWKGSPERIA